MHGGDLGRRNFRLGMPPMLGNPARDDTFAPLKGVPSFFSFRGSRISFCIGPSSPSPPKDSFFCFFVRTGVRAAGERIMGSPWLPVPYSTEN
eukprot:scaffold86_cov338-Pavlova_lutheri.AAC.101